MIINKLARICILILLITYSMSSMGGWWGSDEEEKTVPEEKTSTKEENATVEKTEESESYWDSMLKTAGEVSDSVVETAGEISDATVTAAGSVVTNVTDMSSQTTNWILTSLKTRIEKFSYYNVVMKEAGFQYSGLFLDISIPGGVSFYYVRDAQLSKEQEALLLEKYKGENISWFILKTIFELPELLALSEHSVDELSISFISLPPKIEVMLVSPNSPFKKIEEQNIEEKSSESSHQQSPNTDKQATNYLARRHRLKH